MFYNSRNIHTKRIDFKLGVNLRSCVPFHSKNCNQNKFVIYL
jgi:hypothetical protein